MIKIFLADDHVFVREGLKKFLNSEIDIEVVGEASDAHGTMEFFNSSTCDIALLDISLPGKDGLDLLKELSENGHDVKVIFLTMHPEKIFAERAFNLGAWGYLTKESDPGELLDAIYKVNSGRKYISEDFAEEMVSNMNAKKGRPKHKLLSDREFQIFFLLANGKTVKDISHELSLSISTVNTYRSRIFSKMNLDTNIEIVMYAMKEGLIQV